LGRVFAGGVFDLLQIDDLFDIDFRCSTSVPRRGQRTILNETLLDKLEPGFVKLLAEKLPTLPSPAKNFLLLLTHSFSRCLGIAEEVAQFPGNSGNWFVSCW
jgi:hypothetical protein